MAYAIELTEEADAQLALLPDKIQRQIVKKLDLLTQDPRSPKTKQLVGYPHLRRFDPETIAYSTKLKTKSC